jgi:hypothetical protein
MGGFYYQLRQLDMVDSEIGAYYGNRTHDPTVISRSLYQLS